MSIFGGFGSGSQQSQQQGNTGFGGFGSAANGGSGFGTSGTGFGSGSSTTGGLFGSGTGNSTTSTGFGSGSGGFGSGTQSSGFGSKPAFGTPTSSGGGLFGSGTAASGGTGFGGFGSQSQSSTGFGASSNSGGLFGQQNKSGFGSQGSTGLFGGGSGGGGSGGGGFGTEAAGGGSFGASTSAGFGATSQPQNQGTASTPFTAHTEKDQTNNQNVHYQGITFLQPYQNFSFEELRMADYAQGRRWGNQNGQAGAFGTSTGFGGFGGTSTTGFGATSNTGSGGLFGGNSSGQTPFGQTQPSSTSGFGSTNTGGGLFGQKPSTGLFGNSTSTSQQSGGLFGSSGGAGFGSGNTTGFGSGNSGGGLFGQQNQGQNQSKPAFTGFGGSSSNSFGSGFGNQQPSTGTTGNTGAFGATKPGGLFGNTNTTASPFGGAQQQPSQQQGLSTGALGGFGQQTQGQNQNQSGGLFGGFGNSTAQPQQQQPKSGGLFGTSTSTNNTGTNLFGQQGGANQQQQQQPSTGLFGSTGTQQQGSLFGSKPAATGGGLFGSGTSTGATSTGTGLFGGNQQQTQTTGLFGQAGAQQQKPLFGASSAPSGTSGGAGLFGGLSGGSGAQQTQGSSLFGQSNQQQAPLGGSLFGSTQATMQTQQTPSLTTSLNANPYGNDQLFASLSTPSQSVGPLATPLSSSQKQKKSTILPQYRINPSASSRLITPQKRVQGYGFSYSTYGTPVSSVSSASPTGLGGSMLGGTIGRSLGKSFSTSNLRHSFTAEDSLLAPGAFSPASKLYSSGSLKRLHIDRSLSTRPNLFGDDTGLDDNISAESRKQVSFEPFEQDDRTVNGENSGSSKKSNEPMGKEINEDVKDKEDESLRKPARHPRTNGTGKPESDHASGKELAIVPEESSPEQNNKSANGTKQAAQVKLIDKVPGEYWSKPTLDEIRGLSREQLKNIKGLTVGRSNCGQIDFSKVDLTGIDLEKLFGDIVKIQLRMASVYLTGPKPPRGKGLNVPSTITLENSWPRAKTGRRGSYEQDGSHYEKHVERLKRAQDTEFLDYNPRKGVWRFRVQHFTAYGMDYDGQDDQDTSMAEPPSNFAEKAYPSAGNPPDHSQVSPEDGNNGILSSPLESSPEDTFRFKRDLILEASVDSNSHVNEVDNNVDNIGQTARFENNSSDEYQDGTTQMTVSIDNDKNQARRGSQVDVECGTYEEPTEGSTHHETIPNPKPILKKSQVQDMMNNNLSLDTDWAEYLQRTVSPKKPNRHVLKESQNVFLNQRDDQLNAPAVSSIPTPQFKTSIDVMKSLFAQSHGQDNVTDASKNKLHSIEWPYAKQAKITDSTPDMKDEKLFHQSTKPHWSETGLLIYRSQATAPERRDSQFDETRLITAEGCNIRAAKIAVFADQFSSSLLNKQMKSTQIGSDDAGIPFALTMNDMNFKEFAEVLYSANRPAQIHEKHVWELAGILFDDTSDEYLDTMPDDEFEQEQWKNRKEKLSDFWKELVLSDAASDAFKASSPEGKAIAFLSGFNVWDACSALIEGKNFRLATMVAQIGQGDAMKSEITRQIDDWRRLNMLSEIDHAQRALYELLAGNAYISEGSAEVGAENRAKSFQISSEFNLDWCRAFGLRLWYGINSEEPLEAAVLQYADDLADGELTQPRPWFAEKRGCKATDTRNEHNHHEELLWGLLQLYAAKQGANVKVNVVDILEPRNINGSPVDARLSFQLLHLLRAKEVVDWTGEIEEAADSITSTLATSLIQIGEYWQNAIFVMLHLSSQAARAKVIQEALYQHAADFDLTLGRDSPTQHFGDGRLASLESDLRIPRTWIYSARALYMRSVKADHTAEVHCLLAAGDYQAAHQTLCTTVAPEAIISRSYDALRELLGGFEATLPDDPSRTAMQTIKDWSQGGGIYFDFIHLLDIERRRGTASDSLAKERRKLLRRLTAQLLSIKEQERIRMGLDERAAVWDMARVVADAIASTKEEKHEAANILRLPMTEDMYMKHTREMSVQYYRAVMASAR